MAGRHPRYRGHCVPSGHSTVKDIHSYRNVEHTLGSDLQDNELSHYYRSEGCIPDGKIVSVSSLVFIN